MGLFCSRGPLGERLEQISGNFPREISEFTTLAPCVDMLQNGSETNHGEHISDATRVALASDQISAVGINCTPPADITSLLRHISDEVKSHKEIVIYPNSGDDLSDPGYSCCSLVCVVCCR